MVEIKVRVQIDSPVEKVWNIISEIDNDRTFWKGLASIRNISREGNEITGEVTFGTSNKCMQTVTLFPKEKRSTKWTGGIFAGTKDMVLTPVGNGTQLEVLIRYDLSCMARFMSGKITKDLQFEADEAVRLMKESAEGNSSPGLMMEERTSWADLINARTYECKMRASIKLLFLFLILLGPIIHARAQELSQQEVKPTDKGSIDVGFSTIPVKPVPGEQTKFKIDFINKDTKSIQQHIDYRIEVSKGGSQIFGIPITHTAEGSVTIPYQFPDFGNYNIIVYVEGILFQIIPAEQAMFEVLIIKSQSEIAQSTEIPVWVKNNAKWWAAGEIGDSDFIQGIQYLIVHNIMKIPKTQSDSGSSQKIPTWVKNNAGWWASGKIMDDDFVSGIQYLINNGVMKILEI
ncbi:MAG TPA: SRPBCC family protein [Nitrosopumilaceae archaeon]|nr:SRPBCC family protein [Nitrosopumilaceae archaeon]